MKIKLRTLIIAWAVILLSVLWLCSKTFAVPFDDRVDKALSGGSVATKSMSLWELHRYKYTTLLRKSPMQYCPWESYKAVRDHVHIDKDGFRYTLTIDTNLKKLLVKNAVYNRNYAKRITVTGTRWQKVRTIFKWCNRTHYTEAYNTTRDCFERRKSACAGIAGAFYVLCKVNHIPVRYVIGWVEWGGGCHAWNRVLLSGKWYWVDPTWGWWLNRDLWYGRTVMEIW